MSIWHVLGISETLDVAVIKKAYAEQLKHSKPDEKPTEFQQLHQAYKQAVQHAKVRAGAANANHEITHARVEPVVAVAPLPADAENTQPVDEAAREFDQLVHLIDKLLKDAGKRDQVEAWHFLLASPYIVNLSFARQVGLYTLQQIHHYFHGAGRDARAVVTLSDDVVGFLCSLFGWQEDRDELVSRCGQNVVNAVLAAAVLQLPGNDVLAHVRGGKAFKREQPGDTLPLNAIWYMGNPFKRFLAFLLEYIPLTLLVIAGADFYFHGAIPQELTSWLTFVGLAVYAAFCAACEALPWQTTPGKWIFGMKVFDENRQRLRFRQSCLRGLVCCLSNIGFIIVWLWNSESKGSMVHDKISKTRVYDMRLSLKKYRDSLEGNKKPRAVNKWWAVVIFLILTVAGLVISDRWKDSIDDSAPSSAVSGAGVGTPTAPSGTGAAPQVAQPPASQVRTGNERWLEGKQSFPVDAAQKSRDEKVLHDLESASGKRNYDVFDKDVDTIIEGKH